MEYFDLTPDLSIENASGTPIVAWALPLSDIYLLPLFKGNPESDEIQVYFDDIIPMPYKTFYKIYATSDTGKIDDNKSEGKSSNTYESIYSFFFPKNDKNALGFMRMSATKWVFIIQETDGNLRIMGVHPGQPATISNVAATSGTLTSGSKGVDISIRSIQVGPAPIYAGKFNLDRDNNDLSKYPMLYDEIRVSETNSIGFPLTEDYYYRGVKLFTWHYTYNNLSILINKTIEVHIS